MNKERKNKKSLMINYYVILLSIIIFVAFIFVGCGEEKNTEPINLTLTHNLYEYDVETKTQGDEITNFSIECFARYKLVFNVEFNESDLKTLGDKGVECTIKVNMGDYENEENKVHLTSQNMEEGSGPQFNRTGNDGEWVSKFRLTQNMTDIRLEKSYFIVGIDSMGNGINNTQFQPVTIEFISDRSMVINGYNSYRVLLQPNKATYEWNEDNLSTNIGEGAVYSNIIISIPKYCAEIDLIFWKNSEKKEIYDTIQFSADEYLTEFNKGEIKLVLVDYIKSFVGENKWNEEINSNGYFEVYVEYVAKGGINYYDGIFGVTYQLN